MSDNRMIYVDLDSLLDTRLGLVAKHISQDKALSILQDPEYFTRDSDDWIATKCEMTFEAWRELWHQRDREVLKHSGATMMNMGLHHFFYEELSVQSLPTRGDEYGLIVNLYPYQLTEAEQKDLQAILYETFHWVVDVQLIYTPPELVTPVYLRDNTTAAYMYDPTKWFEKHIQEISEGLFTTVRLHIPKLIYGRPNGSDEFEERLLEKVTIFEALEAGLSVMIAIFYDDVRFFSLPALTDIETQATEQQIDIL